MIKKSAQRVEGVTEERRQGWRWWRITSGSSGGCVGWRWRIGRC